MQPKVEFFNGTRIDYSKSSIETFPAIKLLDDSEQLYFKFSKNLVKSVEHEDLLMDFDLCLIDRKMNETILQLFAIFVITDGRESVNDWKFIELAVTFARILIVREVEKCGLTDKKGDPIVVPLFAVTPESIRLYS